MKQLPSDVRDGDKRLVLRRQIACQAEQGGLVNLDIINTPLTAFFFFFCFTSAGRGGSRDGARDTHVDVQQRVSDNGVEGRGCAVAPFTWRWHPWAVWCKM